MRKEMMLPAAVVFLLCLLHGCDSINEKVSRGEGRAISQAREQTVTKTLVGSAESPDPVLAEVRKLEKEGILRNVRVMESFPVQIFVTGPANIIEKLEKLPRKQLTLPE